MRSNVFTALDDVLTPLLSFDSLYVAVLKILLGTFFSLISTSFDVVRTSKKLVVRIKGLAPPSVPRGLDIGLDSGVSVKELSNDCGCVAVGSNA